MEEKEKQEHRAVYPDIKAKRDGKTLELETYLRVEHEGKWYLWKFYRRAYVPTDNYSAAISSFSRDIYMCQMFGKINPKATYMDGTPIYKMSINQEETEEERLHPDRFFKRAEEAQEETEQ
jgi:hypothetical protein